MVVVAMMTVVMPVMSVRERRANNAERQPGDGMA